MIPMVCDYDTNKRWSNSLNKISWEFFKLMF